LSARVTQLFFFHKCRKHKKRHTSNTT
jgi:hypothetical protein